MLNITVSITSLSGTSFSVSLKVMVSVPYAAFQFHLSPVMTAIRVVTSLSVMPSTEEPLKANPSTFMPL